VPSLVTAIAKNQEMPVQALSANSAGLTFSPADPDSLISHLKQLSDKAMYRQVSQRASEIVDGLGCNRLVKVLGKLIKDM